MQLLIGLWLLIMISGFLALFMSRWPRLSTMVVTKDRLLGLHWLFYNLPIPSVSPVVNAVQAILFLFTRECRSLFSFSLASKDYEENNVTRSREIYLLALHLGSAHPAAHGHVSQPEVNDWHDRPDFSFP